MLAFYLHQLSPFLIEFREGLGLRWYGLAYVASFVLGYWLYEWLAKRGYTDLPPAKVGDFITWAAVFGVMLGGRVGWILFYGWRQVLDDPLAALKIWEGGMSSHGGIIGLVLFTLVWSRRHQVSWTSIGDSLVVVAPIGLLLVRLANFINGELYGRPTLVPWAMLFPNELYENAGLQAQLGLSSHEQAGALLAAAHRDPAVADRLRAVLTPRHPSQLYEAALEGVVLFAALWFLRTRLRLPRGVLTGAFFILYALLRIIGEIFREPDRAWAMGPFSAGQFLSLFLVAIGAAFIIWGFRTQQYERVFGGDAEPRSTVV
ncbi:MAG: phosphatidylglycerol---prolipoprotein diacylglyceryl transferase [Chthoniobacter sp.]|nr:phosphatidylglycerol---prolipoprotein diacylglyceryl transferase [Chthoniobacter sp.]